MFRAPRPIVNGLRTHRVRNDRISHLKATVGDVLEPSPQNLLPGPVVVRHLCAEGIGDKPRGQPQNEMPGEGSREIFAVARPGELPHHRPRKLPNPPHKKTEPAPKKDRPPRKNRPAREPEFVASLGFWGPGARVSGDGPPKLKSCRPRRCCKAQINLG